MVRARFIVQVRYGHFAKYLKVGEQLNEIARDRGWAESTFWVSTVGLANEFIAETEYPDLATFEREGEAFQSDAEVMKLVRSSADLVVQGTGRSELLQAAPQLGKRRALDRQASTSTR
jgi:hypothetical protein